uniref:Uncharacterized protein n=1 Tax=viral metagenome TaxID=1070528 RepID=A0A6M3IDX0_9ZZZZ
MCGKMKCKICGKRIGNPRHNQKYHKGDCQRKAHLLNVKKHRVEHIEYYRKKGREYMRSERGKEVHRKYYNKRYHTDEEFRKREIKKTTIAKKKRDERFKSLSPRKQINLMLKYAKKVLNEA